MAKNNIDRLKALKRVGDNRPVMGGGTLPGFKVSAVTGSSRANGPTEIASMGGISRGSTVAGTNMVHVGGSNKGSTFPNGKTQGFPQGKVKGSTIQGHVPGNYGKTPRGSSITNEKLQKFHDSRGKAKL